MFIILISVIISVQSFDIINESNSCADPHMSPQSYVDIEQLTGMWYGIEIINHDLEAKHELVIEEICPVLYFSQEHIPTTTYNPLHRDHNYDQNYANNYGRGYYDRTLVDEGFIQNRFIYTTQNPYFQTDTPQDYYRRTSYNQPHYNNRRKYRKDIKNLRMLWDQSGVNFEYTMFYNTTKAGLWQNVQNDSVIEPKSIQVLKAVGDHMLLLFCNQSPETHLFSMLLSRMQNMSQHEIHGVHNLLNRRGLSTISIRKVCFINASSHIGSNFILIPLIICINFIKF